MQWLIHAMVSMAANLNHYEQRYGMDEQLHALFDMDRIIH